MERAAKERGVKLKELTLLDMETLWRQQKGLETAR